MRDFDLNTLLGRTVLDESSCMVWTGWVKSKKEPYPVMQIGKTRKTVHRVVASLTLPDYSEELCVMHICDNPRCINPAHLRMGTFADNNRDRESKGRSAPVALESHPRTKLTNEQVAEIKRLQRTTKLTHKQIAQMFDVTWHVIAKIKSGSNWAGVQA